MSKDYFAESLNDLAEDFEDALEKAVYLPKDKHGFVTGTFHVSIVWKNEE